MAKAITVNEARTENRIVDRAAAVVVTAAEVAVVVDAVIATSRPKQI